jgi:hypothetical protein
MKRHGKRRGDRTRIRRNETCSGGTWNSVAGRFAVNLDPMIAHLGPYFSSVHAGNDGIRLLYGHVAINTVADDLRAQLRVHPAAFGLMACEAPA